MPQLRRRLLVGTMCLLAVLTTTVGVGWANLLVAASGKPSEVARSTGNDALWLGHAWVDGRKEYTDVTALAAQLRDTGIHDLFIHAGPLRDDGTLDVSLIPQAGWLTQALHSLLPRVRVQAWLGAHPVPQELHLDSKTTRAAIIGAVDQVLNYGFDGVHFDFEPVADGNPDLLTMLQSARERTRQRGAVLSVSAVHTQPWPGLATAVKLLPGQLALWSTDYLGKVARQVDQVALMSYDTALLTESTYAGYVRRVTESALEAVPPGVSLFIGLPAYHDENALHHRRAETVAAAVRGVRLGLGKNPIAKVENRSFGVALYVDFAATEQDWTSYRRDWYR